MLMPGRKFSSDKYRYGFNGKENDNEVKGDGNQQDYGMRVYDGRIGKFLSVDPLTKKFAWLTPYQFAGNSPIRFIDLDGSEPLDFSANWIRSKEIPTQWNYSVQNVYDKWTEQTWTVMQFPNDPKIYYWKPFDGSQSTFDLIKSKTADGQWTGKWVEFKKQETLQKEYGVQLARGIGVAMFGIIATITGGIAIDGAVSTYGASTVTDFVVNEVKDEIVDQAKDALGVPSISLKDVKDLGKIAKGGRLGSAATRGQIEDISTNLKSRGYSISGGGGERAEEFLKPLGVGKKGGSYPDITATHPDYATLRINTVDVLKDGVTPTAREARNAARIRTQIAPGEHLLLVPKRK